MIRVWVWQLHAGDLVTIRHGRYGRQWALVCTAPREGWLQVKKWKANSSRWALTRTRIPISEVVGRAAAGELPLTAFHGLLLHDEWMLRGSVRGHRRKDLQQ